MIGKTHANTKVMHINIAESDEESLDDNSDEWDEMEFTDARRTRGQVQKGNSQEKDKHKQHKLTNIQHWDDREGAKKTRTKEGN